MNRLIPILLVLLTVRVLQAAVDVAVGHTVWSLGPVEMVILVQVLMAIAGGMPHPSMLKAMGFTEFSYTWLYNSANIIFQNLEKRYHPVPGETVVEVGRTTTTSIRKEVTPVTPTG